MRAPTLTEALQVWRKVTLYSYQLYASGVVVADYADGSLTGKVTADGRTLTIAGRTVHIDNPVPNSDRGAAGIDSCAC